MFEFFRNIGRMTSLLRDMPRLQEEMAQMQAKLGQLVAEGDAGAGMVKAKVNGKMELMSLAISDEAFKMGDKEMLQELVRGAVNQAIGKAREAVAAETAKVGASLGLPPGFKMPGQG
ncbi:MAG: YbaB/EbfC family nucleoid-associated protein [Gemmataceae bacterium]|nr:YbaB/EbfC family nucleoid-associated protein [Gemmataceae bacterium]